MKFLDGIKFVRIDSGKAKVIVYVITFLNYSRIKINHISDIFPYQAKWVDSKEPEAVGVDAVLAK